MPPPLITARWRAAGYVLLAVAALVAGGLALWLHQAARTSFDDWALSRSQAHIGPSGGRFLLHFSEPALSGGVIVLVAAGAALARRWTLLALAATGPLLAVVVTEYLLKPATGRYMYQPGVSERVLQEIFSGAYPSGHETGVAAAALLVFLAAGQLPLRPVARTALLAGLLGWVAIAALGLVRNDYHYATDTVGAVGVAAAVVLALALLIDAIAPAVMGRRLDVRRQLT